ncbi:hypothetical protein [Streptomyces canarius]
MGAGAASLPAGLLLPVLAGTLAAGRPCAAAGLSPAPRRPALRGAVPWRAFWTFADPA